MGNKKSESRVVFAYLTIGIQLAITILVFVIGGSKLDEYYGTSPIFLMVGTILGMGVGFYHLMKTLSEEEQKKIESDNGEKKEKIKWK